MLAWLPLQIVAMIKFVQILGGEKFDSEVPVRYSEAAREDLISRCFRSFLGSFFYFSFHLAY